MSGMMGASGAGADPETALAVSFAKIAGDPEGTQKRVEEYTRAKTEAREAEAAAIAAKRSAEEALAANVAAKESLTKSAELLRDQRAEVERMRVSFDAYVADEKGKLEAGVAELDRQRRQFEHAVTEANTHIEQRNRDLKAREDGMMETKMALTKLQAKAQADADAAAKLLAEAKAIKTAMNAIPGL